jgi:hypothetical protein
LHGASVSSTAIVTASHIRCMDSSLCIP